MEEMIKIIEIPIWLKRCDQMEEKFLEYLISGGKRKIHALYELMELLKFCDRELEDLEIVQLLIDSSKRGEKPHPEDARYVLHLIENCRKDLESILDSEIELFQPLIRKKSEEVKSYKMALKSIIGREINKIENRKRELIKNFIYDNPGEYVKSLTHKLRKVYGKRGLSYSNVSYHIKVLEKEKKIITIGGPQGRYKYCFPNPSKITNFEKYYHSPFAIEGIIKKNVTNYFDTKKARKFYEIHLVSSNGEPNFLLLVGFGVLSKYYLQNMFIKSYGELEPMEFIEKEYHIHVKDNSPKYVKKAPTLLPRKIVMVRDKKEENIWVNKELEDLSVPFTNM